VSDIIPMTFRQRFINNMVSSFAFFLAAFMIKIQVDNLIKGDFVAIGTILYYSIVAGLFLFRKPAQEHSTRFMHWVIALGGCWINFLIITKPDHSPLMLMITVPIQVLSFVLILITISTLGRGFGIIAARRQVVTRGIYQYIRHPLYATELFSGIPIIMQNLSFYNVCLFLTVAACQVHRIFEEEKILSGDPVYVEYCQKVRYRLIPGIF
jgi:protein-S-isoprenylcysteine O-methyltransferase Ste14